MARNDSRTAYGGADTGSDRGGRAGLHTKVIPNPSPSAQHSLLIDPARAVEVALFLREDERSLFGFLFERDGSRLASALKPAKK